MNGSGNVLFQGMSQEQLGVLEQLGGLRVVPKHQYLCTQTTATDQVFLIASGVGLMEHLSSGGDRQVVSFLFPGDFVGVSTGETYDFAVRSLSDMTAHQFPRDALFALSEAMPILKDNLSRIRQMVRSRMLQHMVSLGQKKAQDRVCYFLAHLLQRMPGARAEKLVLPMTRQDIADYLGLKVETVSRAFSRLRKDGLIALPDANSVQILDAAAVMTMGATD